MRDGKPLPFGVEGQPGHCAGVVRRLSDHLAGPIEQPHLPARGCGAQPAGRSDGHDVRLPPRKLRQYRHLVADVCSSHTTVIAPRPNTCGVDVHRHRKDRRAFAMWLDGSW